MRTVPIEVNEATADKITQLSQQEKANLIQLIDIWVNDDRTLREVMDSMATYAQQQGLTPEILKKLLRDE